VLETGETLVIDKKGARKGPKITVGRVCIDSGTIDEFVDDLVIKDRRHLSEDGIVIPIIAVDKHTGIPEGLPEIVSRGFISADESTGLMQEARKLVARTISNSSKEERADLGVMQEKIRSELKRYLTKQTQRRPLIMPVILEV
jgi:ribonuclease J